MILGKCNNMFKKNSKYRGVYLILAFVVFVFGSAMAFYDFFVAKDGMRLFGGIMFAIMAVFQAEDLYVFYKNRRSIN